MADLMFLVTAVVAAMSDESQSVRYGYQIHKRIEQMIGAEVRLTSVYRTLRDMEDAGWLTSRSERHRNHERRCFTLTETGRAECRRLCEMREQEINTLRRLIDSARRGLDSSQAP